MFSLFLGLARFSFSSFISNYSFSDLMKGSMPFTIFAMSSNLQCQGPNPFYRVAEAGFQFRVMEDG